jgi:hypothetical protein
VVIEIVRLFGDNVLYKLYVLLDVCHILLKTLHCCWNISHCLSEQLYPVLDIFEQRSFIVTSVVIAWSTTHNAMYYTPHHNTPSTY